MNLTAIRYVAFADLGLTEPFIRGLRVATTYVHTWELDKQAAETADLVAVLGDADTNRHGSALRTDALDACQR